MLLHWYACISTNTYHFEMQHISLGTNWWALSNTSSIVHICSVIHEILADKAFTATNGLISQSFVVAFIYSTYVQIALIWGFPAQLSLWESIHWLWRYKLNEVCDNLISCQMRFTLGWKSAGWTQRSADLWNDLGFSLCTVPSVCCMVATLDVRKKSKMGVSAEWCVTVEHWRSSSIRDYLCWLSD